MAGTTLPGAMVPLVGSDIEIVRSVREQITRVDLTRYPVLASISKSSVQMRESTKIEWLQDSLNDIAYSSAPYGAQATITARGKPTGRHSHMETFFNAFSLSEETLATGYYGINSRFAYENSKHIAEMCIAIEKHILTGNVGGQAATATNMNTAKTAMLESLISTNARIGGGSATKGGWDTTTMEFISRTRSAVDDQKVVSIDDIEDLALDIWEDQDSPKPAMQWLMARALKQKIDSDAGNFTLGQYRQMIGNADMPGIQTSISNLNLMNGSSLSFMPVKHMKGSSSMFFLDLAGVMILYYYWNRTKPLGAKGISRELLRWFTWTLIYQTEAGGGSLLDRKAA